MAPDGKSPFTMLPEKDLLSDKNYELWSRKVRLILADRQVIEAITETVEIPDQNADGLTNTQYNAAYKLYTEFLKKDNVARIVILGTMRNDFMMRYDTIESAKEIWESVRTDLGGTTTAQLRRLQMSFDRFVKLPHTSMTQHCTVMRNMISELAQAGQVLSNEQ